MDIEKIMTEGVVFKKASGPKPKEDKIKTKAKKKTYITGLHGSGAAKMKAEIRKKRANRHKGKSSLGFARNSLHSCHRMVTDCASMNKGWQDSCHPLFVPATGCPSPKDVLSCCGKMYYLVAVRRMDLSAMRLFAENAAAFFLNAAAFCLKYRGVWEDGRRSVKK